MFEGILAGSVIFIDLLFPASCCFFSVVFFYTLLASATVCELILKLGGGFNIFYFHPYLGKIPILTNIFQGG